MIFKSDRPEDLYYSGVAKKPINSTAPHIYAVLKGDPGQLEVYVQDIEFDPDKGLPITNKLVTTMSTIEFEKFLADFSKLLKSTHGTTIKEIQYPIATIDDTDMDLTPFKRKMVCQYYIAHYLVGTQDNAEKRMKEMVHSFTNYKIDDAEIKKNLNLLIHGGRK